MRNARASSKKLYQLVCVLLRAETYTHKELSWPDFVNLTVGEARPKRIFRCVRAARLHSFAEFRWSQSCLCASKSCIRENICASIGSRFLFGNYNYPQQIAYNHELAHITNHPDGRRSVPSVDGATSRVPKEAASPTKRGFDRYNSAVSAEGHWIEAVLRGCTVARNEHTELCAIGRDAADLRSGRADGFRGSIVGRAERHIRAAQCRGWLWRIWWRPAGFLNENISIPDIYSLRRAIYISL